MIAVSLQDKTVTLQMDVETAGSIERVFGIIERALNYNVLPTTRLDGTRVNDLRTKLRNTLALVGKY